MPARLRRLLLPPSLLLAMLALPVHADPRNPTNPPNPSEAKQDRPTSLPVVRVEADGRERAVDEVPAAVSVIAADEIQEAGPRLSVAESLRRVPGLSVRERQNEAQDVQLSIRGFGSRASFGVRGVRLLSDGIPASMPDGQGQVSHLSLDEAARIEVLRGPYSVAHGNAAGGVIQLISREPPPHAQWSLDAVAGADALRRWSLGASGPLDQGSMAWRAMQVDGEGFRDHSAQRRQLLQGRVRWDDDRGGRWLWIGNALHQDALDPQGLTAEEVAGDPRAASPNALRFNTRKQVKQWQNGLRWLAPEDASAWMPAQASAYFGQRDVLQFLSTPVATQANPAHPGGVIDLDRNYAGIHLGWMRPQGDHDWSWGLRWEALDEDRRGFENFVGAALGQRGELRRDERQTVQSGDAYLQWRWRSDSAWRVEAGLRAGTVRFVSRDRYVRAGNPDDSAERAYGFITPSLAIAYQQETWQWFANLGRGVETPTLTELAYRADGGSGANTELRAARSLQAESGLRWRRGDWQGEALGFIARTQDDLVLVASSGGRSVFDNVGGTQRHGLELWLNHGEDADTQRWQMSYTWLDARYREGFATCSRLPCPTPDRWVPADTRMPAISRHQLWTQWRWRPVANWVIGVEASARSRFSADDAGTAFAPGGWRGDVFLSREWNAASGRWRAFLRVDDVLDRAGIGSVIVNDLNGRFFEPAPGRQWWLGLSWNSGEGSPSLR